MKKFKSHLVTFISAFTLLTSSCDIRETPKPNIVVEAIEEEILTTPCVSNGENEFIPITKIHPHSWIKNVPDNVQNSLVINNMEDYRKYIGSVDLAEIDFNKYTLLAGKMKTPSFGLISFQSVQTKDCKEFIYTVRIKGDIINYSGSEVHHFALIPKIPTDASVKFEVAYEQVSPCDYVIRLSEKDSANSCKGKAEKIEIIKEFSLGYGGTAENICKPQNSVNINGINPNTKQSNFIINTEEELKEHFGCQIPEVDFSKHTLLVGFFLSGNCANVRCQSVSKICDSYEYNVVLNELACTAVTPISYFVLIPKISTGTKVKVMVRTISELLTQE